MVVKSVTSLWGVPELCWDRGRPEDALCPGGVGDLCGCSVFACIAVPPPGEAQAAAARTSSASGRTTWQTGEAGDAVGLLLVGWGSEPEPAASNECAAACALQTVSTPSDLVSLSWGGRTAVGVLVASSLRFMKGKKLGHAAHRLAFLSYP